MIQSRIQFIGREFENLSMRKGEKVSDYSMRFTKVISELRDLGENLEEKDVMAKLLRSLQQEFDSLTLSLSLSLSHIGTIKPMTVEEVLGSLRVHESRLIERDNREEEQTLLKKNPNYQRKMTEIRHLREEGDLVREEEEEDMEEEDMKRKNMRKMKRILLTSPKLSAIIVKRWGTLLMSVSLRKRRKGKSRK